MDNISYFIPMFPKYISDVFNSFDSAVKEQINEIRLRKSKPLIIYIKDSAYFVEYTGRLSEKFTNRCITVTAEDFDSVCDKLCSHSYHTNMPSLIDGYITVKNGSRVGAASTAVIKEGKTVSVKNITSLNIRISHEYNNCSAKILDLIYRDNLPSIIVAGRPNCGKTTFLRDYARQISNGRKGKAKKVSIVDERQEISGSFDVGINSDVLCGFKKAKGIEIATRTLSPDLIVCDEIGSTEELGAITNAFASGVSFAVSVHLKDADNIFNNNILLSLIETNQFDYIVILKSYTDEFEIIDLGEVKLESGRNDNDNPFFFLPWINGG